MTKRLSNSCLAHCEIVSSSFRSHKSRPYLDGVLDLVREVLDGANRRLLLRRVLRRRVRLGEMRNDDLRVTLRAQRAGLEERLQVEDAALVHVLT